MTAPPSSSGLGSPPVGEGDRVTVEEFATATSAELARLVRAERVMIRTRWIGVAFALVQVLTYYLPYPPGMLELALGLTALIAAGNVVIWWVLPSATTLRRARRLSVAALALNGVLFTGLVFVYTFDTETAIFALLYVLPMEAAIRFQLRGALWTLLAVTVAYTVREAVGTLVYGHPFLVVSISFRMGIGLIIAAIAGGIAQTLIRDREQLAALNAITRELATAVSPQDVLDGAARRIGALLRAPAVAIAVADAEGLQVRAVSAAPGARAGHAVGDAVPVDGAVRDVLDAGRARLVADPHAPPRRRWWRRGGDDGLLLAPLLARGETVGLVLAGTGGRDRRFSGAELALVETVAGQLAGALVSAGLYVEARDARDAADRANEAKSAFLANMSHEIRTPMNAVIGTTELLRSTPMSREQTELVDIARSSGENLLRIIDDVLDFSKIEADRLELERIPMDLRDCLEGALDVLAQRAAATGVDLVGVVAPDVPGRVYGDPVRLRQVLVNLVGNAVKFTGDGEVVASVMCGVGDGAVRVEVADTGPGIPAERLDRLFRSFSQVDVSTTRRHGGTGLGLAISQRIVGLMGGRIDVRSVVGEGSVFAFEVDLPAVPGAPDPPAPTALRGRRVLVADTPGARRRALAAQCAAWGAEVVECGPDDEWARPSARERYDVVVVHGTGFARGCDTDSDGDTEPCPVPVVALCPLGAAGSGPGEGSAVARAGAIRISLPVKHGALVDALDRASGVGVPVTAPEPGADEPLPPLRILLAEDHAVNRTLAVRLLSAVGLSADLAENGLEVLTALDGNDYDVVLMDVQMPELDGLETARRIVGERGADRPWLVAVTANAMAGDREMCLDAGMDDYLAKPIRRDALVEALRRVPLPTRPARPDPGPADEGPADDGPADDGPADDPAAAIPAEREPDPVEWEPATLRELAESFGPDGDGVVAELVDTAAVEVPATAARLRAAHLAGDVAAVRREAHALKSTAAALGAPALAARCRDVETGLADPAELAGRVERDAIDLVARLRTVAAARQ